MLNLMAPIQDGKGDVTGAMAMLQSAATLCKTLSDLPSMVRTLQVASHVYDRMGSTGGDPSPCRLRSPEVAFALLASPCRHWPLPRAMQARSRSAGPCSACLLCCAEKVARNRQYLEQKQRDLCASVHAARGSSAHGPVVAWGLAE